MKDEDDGLNADFYSVLESKNKKLPNSHAADAAFTVCQNQVLKKIKLPLEYSSIINMKVSILIRLIIVTWMYGISLNSLQQSLKY